MTIKFLKPRKLGAASESWLRQEVRSAECTAATCLYFLFSRAWTMGARGCRFGFLDLDFELELEFGRALFEVVMLDVDFPFPLLPFACDTETVGTPRLMLEFVRSRSSAPVTVAEAIGRELEGAMLRKERELYWQE